MNIKGYCIRTDEGPSLLVLTKSQGRAKSLASMSNTYEGYDFTELRVKREPDIDKYSEKFGEVVLEDSPEASRIMWNLGWYTFDDMGESCSACSRYEWEGIPESQTEYINEEPFCQECKEHETAR